MVPPVLRKFGQREGSFCSIRVGAQRSKRKTLLFPLGRHVVGVPSDPTTKGCDLSFLPRPGGDAKCGPVYSSLAHSRNRFPPVPVNRSVSPFEPLPSFQSDTVKTWGQIKSPPVLACTYLVLLGTCGTAGLPGTLDCAPTRQLPGSVPR